MAHMQGGSSSLPAQLDRQKSEGEGQSRSYSRSPGKTRPSGEKNPLLDAQIGGTGGSGAFQECYKVFYSWTIDHCYDEYTIAYYKYARVHMTNYDNAVCSWRQYKQSRRRQVSGGARFSHRCDRYKFHRPRCQTLMFSNIGADEMSSSLFHAWEPE